VLVAVGIVTTSAAPAVLGGASAGAAAWLILGTVAKSDA
jgi:hypothetical protein